MSQPRVLLSDSRGDQAARPKTRIQALTATDIVVDGAA